jgi:hypothetical protein
MGAEGISSAAMAAIPLCVDSRATVTSVLKWAVMTECQGSFGPHLGAILNNTAAGNVL